MPLILCPFCGNDIDPEKLTHPRCPKCDSDISWKIGLYTSGSAGSAAADESPKPATLETEATVDPPDASTTTLTPPIEVAHPPIYCSPDADGRSWTFSLAPSQWIVAPNVCPKCGQPAEATASIRADDFGNTEGEMALWGLLGQVVKFAIGGIYSEELIQVNLCRSCKQQVVMFKTLEWLTRVVGVGLTIALMVHLSTPGNPLIKQGIGMIILVLLPAVAAAIVSYIFRRQSIEWRGVVFTGAEHGMNRFQACNAEWAKRLAEPPPAGTLQLSPADQKAQERLVGSGTPDAFTAFLIRTYHAWKAGALGHIPGSTQQHFIHSMSLKRGVSELGYSYGRSIKAVLRTHRFAADEWLVGAGKRAFVLTNKKLYLFLDSSNSGQITALSLNDMTSYSYTTCPWSRFILRFEMRGVRILEYGPLRSAPLDTFVYAFMGKA